MAYPKIIALVRLGDLGILPFCGFGIKSPVGNSQGLKKDQYVLFSQILRFETRGFQRGVSLLARS